MPALAVPQNEVIDTNGAGDIFHGAYVYSYLQPPEKPWEAHFRFARAASAHSVRYLGIEHSLPTRADVLAAEQAVPRSGVTPRPGCLRARPIYDCVGSELGRHDMRVS